MHLNAVGQLVLKETTVQMLVLCYWKDVCFLSVSTGNQSFYRPSVNRVTTARISNNMVMNEPAVWGGGNHVEFFLEQNNVW